MLQSPWKPQIDRTIGTPLYQQIFDSVRVSILSGELKPGTPMPSERDLIVKLGITRPTLRQALQQLEKQGFLRRQHGVGTFIEDPTRWHPARRVLNLGLVTWAPEFKGYSKDLLGHLCAEATGRGMQVQTMLSPNPHEPLEDLSRRVLEGQCDGVIAFATGLRRNLEQLAALQIPKVLLELRDRVPGADNAVVDGSQGVYDGVTELVRLGHRKIGFVGALICDHNAGREGIFKMAPETETRFKAYRRALADHGIAYQPEWYAELPFTDEVVDEWAARRTPPGVTAFVAFDDLLASLLAHGFKRRGLEIPRDVSVLGFGDIMPEARNGALATVRADFKGLAQLAVERIQERAERGGMAGLLLSAEAAFKPGASIGPSPTRNL